MLACNHNEFLDLAIKIYSVNKDCFLNRIKTKSKTGSKRQQPIMIIRFLPSFIGSASSTVSSLSSGFVFGDWYGDFIYFNC